MIGQGVSCNFYVVTNTKPTPRKTLALVNADESVGESRVITTNYYGSKERTP